MELLNEDQLMSNPMAKQNSDFLLAKIKDQQSQLNQKEQEIRIVESHLRRRKKIEAYGKLMNELNIYSSKKMILNSPHKITNEIILLNGSLAKGRRTSLTISRYSDNQYSDMAICDPILIVTIPNNNDTFIEPQKLIERIELDFGGNRIDRIDSVNLLLLLKLYNLNWTFVDNTLILPLPLDILINDNAVILSKMQWYDARMNIEFGQGYDITDCELQLTYYNFTPTEQIEQNNNLLKFLLTHVVSDKIINYDIIGFNYKYTEFCGSETFLPNSHNAYRLCFTGFSKDMYFTFTDETNNIITDKLFESLKILYNGYEIFIQSYPLMIHNTKQKFNSNTNKFDGIYWISIQNKDKINCFGAIDSAKICFVKSKEESIHKDKQLLINIFAISTNTLAYGNGVSIKVMDN
jgi:hypothetical protein